MIAKTCLFAFRGLNVHNNFNSDLQSFFKNKKFNAANEMFDVVAKNGKTYIQTKDQSKFKGRSWVYRLTHGREKLKIDKMARNRIAAALLEYNEKVVGKDISFFKEGTKINVGTDYQDKLGKKVWKFALRMKGIRYSKRSKVSLKKLEKINQVFDKQLIHAGRGMMPGDLETYSNLDNNLVELKAEVKKLNELCSHILGWEDNFADILKNKDLVQNIQVKSSPEFLENAKKALRLVLSQSINIYQKNILSNIDPDGNPYKEQDIQKKEMFFNGYVQQVLSLIPFFGPEEGDVFPIPVKNAQGEFELVDYTVNKVFNLSPSFLGTPLIAAGFIPAEGSNAAPLISFSGTPLPGGNGYGAGVLSDMTPFMSPGHAASLYARNEISAWLKEYAGEFKKDGNYKEGKKPANIVGASLGGGLCLHTLRLHGKYIGEIHAFNPAGTHPWDWWGHPEYDQKVNIYSQENDVVSSMGYYPRGENVKVYRIFGSKPENLLFAHARVYMGSKQVVVIDSDLPYEHKRIDRLAWTILHVVLSPIFFLPTFLITVTGVAFKSLGKAIKNIFKSGGGLKISKNKAGQRDFNSSKTLLDKEKLKNSNLETSRDSNSKG